MQQFVLHHIMFASFKDHERKRFIFHFFWSPHLPSTSKMVMTVNDYVHVWAGSVVLAAVSIAHFQPKMEKEAWIHDGYWPHSWASTCSSMDSPACAHSLLC